MKVYTYPSATRIELILIFPVGHEVLKVLDVPASLVREKPISGHVKIPCLICKETQTVAKMRDHVGGHILRSMRSKQNDEYADLVRRIFSL